MHVPAICLEMMRLYKHKMLYNAEEFQGNLSELQYNKNVRNNKR